jgi:NADPH-dependent 2,4-dienoyl-CoA reductase/sulfur reductase-like enzyme
MKASTYMPMGLNRIYRAIKKSGKYRFPFFFFPSARSCTRSQAEEIIASGKADCVRIPAALIADPFLPKKSIDGRTEEIVPCLRCLNCTDSDNLTRHFVCSVNPYIGREARIGFADTMEKAKNSKKVLIAGGGPAGMQAAITAALRGHEVVLCEKSGALGGLLKFTDTDSLKHDLRRYKDYLIKRVQSLNIRILLNTEVSQALLEQLRPDAIIVAAGSTSMIPRSVKGIEKAFPATDIYFNPANIKGDQIVIIGGGLVGVETGLHLANTGKHVTVLEMQNEYAPDSKMVYKFGLMRKVGELGLTIVTNALCTKVTNGGVTYLKDGKEQLAEADTVLYAVGMKSNEQPYFELYDKAPFVYEAGDCKKVGKVDGAIHSGHFAAMDIGML